MKWNLWVLSYILDMAIGKVLPVEILYPAAKMSYFLWEWWLTLQKWEICAQQNIPEKLIRKCKYFFFIFQFNKHYFFPYEYPDRDLCQHRPGQGIHKGKSKVSRNENKLKTTWVFLDVKYRKIMKKSYLKIVLFFVHDIAL